MREKGGLNILLRELPTIPYTRVIEMPPSAFPATRKSIEDLKVYLIAGKVLALGSNPSYRKNNAHFRYNYELEGFRIKSRTYRNTIISMSVVFIEILGFRYLIFDARLTESLNKHPEVNA